jgi:DNA-binding PadR family transcriptional regulator
LGIFVLVGQNHPCNSVYPVCLNYPLIVGMVLDILSTSDREIDMGYTYQITAQGKYRLHDERGRVADWPLLDTKAEALGDIRDFDRNLRQLRSDEASERIMNC